MCLGLPRDCHTERLGKFWVKDMPLRVGTFTPDGRVAALHSSFAACCWATDRWKTSRTCYGLLRPRSGSRCTSGRWLVRRKKSEYWTGDGELTVFDDTAQPQGGPQPPKANGFWSARKQRNLNADRPTVIYCSGSLGRWHIAGSRRGLAAYSEGNQPFRHVSYIGADGSGLSREPDGTAQEPFSSPTDDFTWKPSRPIAVKRRHGHRLLRHARR